MPNMLHPDANRIPCGLCCRQKVLVRPTDDQELPTVQCTDWGDHPPSDDDLATYGDRILLQDGEGYCVHLAMDKSHCVLVDGEVDRRPYACRDEGWPTAACESMGCRKLARD